jgi:hypothetical protein
MYYWAGSTMPVYPKTRGTRPPPKPSKKKGKAAAAAALTSASSPSPVSPRLANGIPELFEPAVVGSPSPDRVRASSKQVKRTSVASRQQAKHASGSSREASLRSRESLGRQPSWEQGMDGISLSRKSSGRSTSSSMPSRERPESVQIFGKTIFNRRNRLKRESSAQSSSEGSLYSADAAADRIAKDPVMPTLFSRRRGTRPEGLDEHTAAQRKFQISSPYNFQHVGQHAHDQFNEVEEPDSAFRDDDMSSEAAMPSSSVLGSAPLGLRKTQSPPMRLIKHARSQEQLRGAPPRPPRSPLEPGFATSPIPPPRLSSRASIRTEGTDRPQTSGGSRQVSSSGRATLGANALSRDGDMAIIPEELNQHTTNAQDDSNWPLPSAFMTASEASLPFVPEDEEQHVVSRPSRTLSIKSNNSSLRGSQSVPMLRQVAHSQQTNTMPYRPSSGASDTLGHFDSFSAPRAPSVDAEEFHMLSRDRWEEDIDYCYDHEVEADCDYAWDRASMDLHRAHDEMLSHDSALKVPALRVPGVQAVEMPALSPASQASTVTRPEAITPTAPAMLMNANNYSAPRADPLPQRLPLASARSDFHASDSKESHAFQLSPPLLIPGDFRQQMIASLPEGFVEHEELAYPYDEASLMANKLKPRTSGTSASTAGSDSERSGMFERHISGTSATTDLTRLTMSTNSVDMEPYYPKFDARPDSLIVDESDVKLSRSSAKNIMPIVPESEESPERRAQNPQSPQPEQSIFNDEKQVKRRDSFHTRRQRMRASSIPPPPPAGQYAMFPAVKMYGTHI